MAVYIAERVVRATAPRARFWKAPVFASVLGTGLGGEVPGENTWRVWMQVYLIACAKRRAQAPKPAGIISVQRRTHGTRGRKVRLSRKLGSQPAIPVSLCLSLSETAISCLPLFSVYLALDFCSLMTATCLGLAWNCSVSSLSSPNSSMA